VRRPGQGVDELKLQRTALRRREFQARLQAERAIGEQAHQLARERNDARIAELREQQLQETRAAALREEQRLAREREAAATSRAVQAAAQAREEQPPKTAR